MDSRKKFLDVPVWGHRGWPARYPDNVFAGIEAAATVAAGVEVDIRRSADGELVLAHDPEIAGRVVADTYWHQLADIDIDGHSPARLTDIERLAVPLDLEVKNLPGQPGFEPDDRLAFDVAEWARPGDVVTSFWWPSLDAVRRRFPDVPTGLLFDESVAWTDALAHASTMGHIAIAPHHRLVDAALAEAAADACIDVVVWTVNDETDARRLAALGVAAIITDRPGELIAEAPSTERP